MRVLEPFQPGEFTPQDADSYSGLAGRIVLVGPPGTGKTTAALDEFVLPAMMMGSPPDRILCCSFTVAAATELRERLGRQTNAPPTVYKKTCSTIHAEAYRVLREQGRRDLTIYDGMTLSDRPSAAANAPDEDHDAPDAASDKAQRIQLNQAATTIREAALTAYSYARNVLWEPDSDDARAYIAGLCGTRRDLDPAKVFESMLDYIAEKARVPGRIDFSDMLINAAAHDGRDLDLLIVDEAQDCTPLQWRLVDRWMAHAKRVVLIADPDQAIHEWAGAAPHLLARYIEDPEWQPRYLPQSYRVPELPHAAARIIITANRNRHDAPYSPRPERGSTTIWATPAGAAAALAANPPPSALIMGRTRAVIDSIAKHLAANLIPFVNERGASPLGSEVTNLSLAAILKWQAGLTCSRQEAHRALEAIPAKPYFLCKKKDAAGILATYPDDIPFPATILSPLLLAADPITACKDSARARALIPLVAKHGHQILEDAPPHTLTTMHASKGREAHTAIVLLAKPWVVSNAEDRHPEATAEQERRLLYVAMTRCTHALWLVGAGGGDLYHEPLRAAEEAPSRVDCPF